jgi:PAS domain S-box-containing protein
MGSIMADILLRPTPEAAADFLFRRLGEENSVESGFRNIINVLPAAVYVTDALGRITYFNEAAATLWGHRPTIGSSEWCGSWKLFWPDGRALPHGECPMAIAIKEKRAVRGMEAVAERPDGTRVSFEPYPTPIFDSDGGLTGAVNMLIDITDRKRAEQAKQHLAAIVEFSDDAIISINLLGIIQSWNSAAERIYGYTVREAIGQSVDMLIPPDRSNEEPEILNRIRGARHIEHYETVRLRKDGSLIDISLTVSPIIDGDGRVVGASKIARDITERRKAQEQRDLLLREMNHRVRNLFTLARSVVALSARSVDTSKELATIVGERLDALARAHALTLPKRTDQPTQGEQATTLHNLIRAIVLPYENTEGRLQRIVVSGPDIPVSAALVTDFALLLHEIATNAAKYGALSNSRGSVDISCTAENGVFSLIWTERGGPRINEKPASEGFGSQLARATVVGRLGGKLRRDWNPDGLTIHLSVSRERLAG